MQLPPDRRLAAQLAAPTWKLRGDQILIESKDDIRARLGSSTDDADAVAPGLAQARYGNGPAAAGAGGGDLHRAARVDAVTAHFTARGGSRGSA